MINVLFFASLREQLKLANMQISSDNIATVADVKQHLIGQGEPFYSAIHDKRLLAAINEVMCHNDDSLVNDGDTLALFPPVTGG
ncbi:MoaD/ThiS family protein [Thalassotalea maritima]|uniref:MoaD/ThiS family protein n=1 Tax=Thalassotalea maritima TaxID=3242416 RepID=UPI0035272447